MGNKTIYFKDDQLWDRAKELAGKDGISGVVQDALAAFVDQKKRQAAGFNTYRLPTKFRVGRGLSSFGTTERIAFEGQLIAEQRMDVPVPGRESDFLDLTFRIYRTRGGKLVITVGDDENAGKMFGIHHYGVYKSLAELSDDESLKDPDPIERAAFLDKAAKELGEDWAVWID
jgi:hypothetical protein